jgi:predicted DNA-binding protein (UPF0251 family)
MSPRPVKRRVCNCDVKCEGFKPTRIPMKQVEKIALGHDELEALRLCDRDGLTQEEAGRKMKISRGTVHRLVTSGRYKTARALAENCALILTDPSKKKTSSAAVACGCDNCRKCD